MFITPNELRNECEWNGIQLQKVVGEALDKNFLFAVREVRRYKRGVINSAELGDNLVLRKTGSLMLNYVGYGIKCLHKQIP